MQPQPKKNFFTVCFDASGTLPTLWILFYFTINFKLQKTLQISLEG